MADGTYRTAEGEAVRGPYVLVDDSIAPDGIAVGRDPGRGMTVWRVDGPLIATTTTIKGLYPGDTWSGKSVTWTRERCRGGTLVAALTSDPALFSDDQIVTASIGGRRGRAHEGSTDRGAHAQGPLAARTAARAGLSSRSLAPGCRGGGDDSRARRPLLPLLHPVRIAFDVSPLSHPRTGIGNYVRGSLAGLAEAAAGQARADRLRTDEAPRPAPDP